jgi:hypothetical protein
LCVSAAERQQRFLLLSYGPSLPTAEWLNEQAAESISVQVLGVLDGILVAEFCPLVRANNGAGDQPTVGSCP